MRDNGVLFVWLCAFAYSLFALLLIVGSVAFVWEYINSQNTWGNCG